jgi:hypothetical protein
VETGVAQCQLVIEIVREGGHQLEAFAALDKVCLPGKLLASTTSSISRLADVSTPARERIIRTHPAPEAAHHSGRLPHVSRPGVESGATVAVVEAMKIEHRLVAPISATIGCALPASVAVGQIPADLVSARRPCQRQEGRPFRTRMERT